MAGPSHASGLIDTDILVDASRGLPEASRFLAEQRSQSAARISVVSAMELVAGCRNAQDLAEVRRFLSEHALEPVTAHASTAALELMKSFFLSHSLLIPDALIAASARENSLTLLTKNTRHYQMIPGLRLNRPY